MREVKLFPAEVVLFMGDYEDGLLDEAEVVKGFQMLLDCGVLPYLPYHYSQKAKELAQTGLCTV